MKRQIILPLVFLILSLSGCASMKEAAKCVIGVSTKDLQDGRKDAIKKTFGYDYKTCYDKTKGILKEKGCYIYAEDAKKGMIAVYLSREDTTPVGLFFTAQDANNTQIEVSGPSTYAKEVISEKVFTALEGESLEKKE